LTAERTIFFLTGKDNFQLLKGFPSGGIPPRMLNPIPKSPNVQSAEWQRWFNNARRNVNPAASNQQQVIFSIGSVSFTQGCHKSAYSVGAQAGGTATNGGYGFVSAAEFNAHMAQVEAMRQALIALGAAVP